MHRIQRLLAAALLVLPFAVLADPSSGCEDTSKPCLRLGAAVFEERCALCHGNDGMGEGPLSLVVKDYPSVNLMVPRVANDDASLRRAIIEGPGFADINPLMPPWGNELDAMQLESVISYVSYMRKDIEGALKIAKEVVKSTTPSVKLGRAIFLGHCVLCHGHDGEGNGRMAARLTTKPVNLTRSRAPDSYLKTIISRGGEEVGHSPVMPKWGEVLTEPEMDSLVLYINAVMRPPHTAAPDNIKFQARASARAGASVYADNCAACHGAEGRGDGPVAANLPVKPVHLGKSRAPDGLMKAIVYGGSAAAGRSEFMPAWGETLSALDIDSVILHIKTFRPAVQSVINNKGE